MVHASLDSGKLAQLNQGNLHWKHIREVSVEVDEKCPEIPRGAFASDLVFVNCRLIRSDFFTLKKHK